MLLSIDGTSLRRRLVHWGVAYAVAVLPCVITAGSGRGLLVMEVIGLALGLGLVATALSSAGRAWPMRALAVAAVLVVLAGLLSVVAWTVEETDGKWLWAWLTALALLCVSAAGLEATMGVFLGLRAGAGGPGWASGPATAPGLSLRRIASWGALLCGIGLFVILMRADYQNAARSVYWGARDAGLLGLSTLLWPDVPLLLAVTFMLGGLLGAMLGVLAWGLMRGVSRLLGASVRPPDEPLPPPA
jgi:hypothetical protein